MSSERLCTPEEPEYISLLTQKQLCAQVKAADFVIHERHLSGIYVPVMAEIVGMIGLLLQHLLAAMLRHTPFGALLWTQYYVAKGNAAGLSPRVNHEVALC